MGMSVGGGGEDEPMMDMNTTPLIDVMLVLLVMFIITIPIQTHAVKIDLPPQVKNPPPVIIKPVKNDLSVTQQNVITWNNQPISLVDLKQTLIKTTTIVPEPELHFQPQQDARFEMVDEVLATIKYSKVTKMGFVGNENYTGF